jgi:hypothetical protein
MALTLTRQEVREYAHRNQYAMLMFMGASSDYFACRCCILNGLFCGFRLASEAVEKLLKAFIFLQTGARSTLKGRDRHNPYLLKKELTALRPDKNLDTYDDLLQTLYDHFLSRYYDNPTTGKGASGEELPLVDELFLYLVESLPMPDEIKYRSAFFAHLCEENDRKYWRNYYWAMERNEVLNKKMPLIERTYQQVRSHLYG